MSDTTLKYAESLERDADSLERAASAAGSTTVARGLRRTARDLRAALEGNAASVAAEPGSTIVMGADGTFLVPLDVSRSF